MKYALIFGNNFEDVEGITQLDLLRRAGVHVDTFGVGSQSIRSRSNLIIQTDKVFQKESDIEPLDYEGIILPGGPGVKELLKNEELLNVIRDFYGSNKLIFAICAAPELLNKAGILEDHKFTCYPDSISAISAGDYVDKRVVIDGNIITSQGVGTSLDAAIKLVEVIVSKEESEKQAGKVLYHK